MITVLKTLSQKMAPIFAHGRYILIVGSALILAILLYSAFRVSDSAENIAQEESIKTNPASDIMIGVEPASFQQIEEITDGNIQRLQLSGHAQAGAAVVITNRGERLRQVPVDETGQWRVILDVLPSLMVLKAQLYMDEESTGVRSEETVFRLPTPQTEALDGKRAIGQTSDVVYKTSSLIMVTAPGSPSRIIQSPFGGVPSTGPLSLSVIDYDYTGGVIITGSSSIPGRVRLFAEDKVIGETGIGVGGRWNFIAGHMLPGANITLRAALIPAAGTPNAPREPAVVSIPFVFIPPPQEGDNSDASGSLFVNIDPLQWQIRRTLIGGGAQSTIIFAPNAAQ